MNFVSREQVLAEISDPDIRRAVERLPYFPAPNPDMKDGRNALGQTEDEFWGRVDDQEAQKSDGAK